MGFVLSVLYLVSAYLGPETIFGPIAEFRVGLILAVLVLLISLPSLPESFLGKTPQTLALMGLAFSVLVSVLMTGWAGGATTAFLAFIPNAFAYFLVCLHCDSKKKLQVIILMLLFVCLFVIAHGYSDLRAVQVTGGQGQASESPYLLPQKSDAGDWFYRIRGLDFINDPNDFAQVIVCVTPLVFIFWQPKKKIRNFFLVLVPVGGLFFGAFLTHSRGAILGILAMTVVAARRRVGTLVSLLMAGGLFAAASALQFTGGREISADAGSGRMDAWAFGLDLLKSHPIIGVGYGRFTEYYPITAHNTIVVCATELGLVGLFFWSLFLFPTVRDAIALASPTQVSDGEVIVVEKSSLPGLGTKIEDVDKEEINRLGRLMVLSLTGLLVTSWFLSRSYSMTLFLVGGVVEVIYQMALQRGMIARRMALLRVMRSSVVMTFSLVLLVYVVLRSGNLMR
jgi:O-antigen ligase